MQTRLIIIGSSHISNDSVNEVRREFESFKPDIIALELDNTRIKSLFDKKQKHSFSDINKSFGVKSAVIISFLSYIQKKLGKIVNTEPGSEMKEAVIIARKNKLQLELIDQNIELTLQKLSKAITFKFILKILREIISAPFKKNQKISIDLSKVPDDAMIEKLLFEVKKAYPEIHNVLIEERNVIMAKRLYTLSRNHPEKKILAVVGAGHKSEMIKLIQKYEKEN